MGNGLSPCFNPFSKGLVKIVFWGGATEVLAEKRLAGEIMFRFPDSIVCDADSFYIGHPVPALSLEDELLPGHTYFVLPIDRLPACHGPLTAVSLSALSPGPAKPSLATANGGQCPFEYVRGGDGRAALIKVVPEFLTKVISAAGGGQRFGGGVGGGGDGGTLCSTPELKKHYAQLVGPRERPWSPTLETITERKKRLLLYGGSLSPVRLLGLERRSC